MNLSVIGLGKLGLCTAAFLASRGFSVAGFDNDPALTDQLLRGVNPIDEPGLDDLLKVARPNLTIVNDLAQAVLSSDVTLIIVPTPSGRDGFFSNDHILDVLRAVGSALTHKNRYHVVDVVSTVMPGSSEQVFIPMLEGTSRRKCGQAFGFVYNPEFIALGTVIRDFSRPDLVLIGASDQRAAEAVAGIYRRACLNTPPVCTMSLTNAEIAKLALNCYVTMKISFANELARLCEKIPGADVDIVTSALGHDTRIGCKCLAGGLGFGGPCFPRDNIAFFSLARSIGLEARLGLATQQINHQVVAVLEQIIQKKVPRDGRISLLGMTYKPGSPIIEASQSMQLALCLLDHGYQLTVSDPVALAKVGSILLERATYREDAYQACENADAIVLMTPWPEYRRLDWDRVDRLAVPGGLLLDCWRIAPGQAFHHLRHHALGIGTEAAP